MSATLVSRLGGELATLVREATEKRELVEERLSEDPAADVSDDQSELHQIISRGREIREQLDELRTVDGAIVEMREAVTVARPSTTVATRGGLARRSWGDSFVGSEDYRRWVDATSRAKTNVRSSTGPVSMEAARPARGINAAAELESRDLVYIGTGGPAAALDTQPMQMSVASPDYPFQLFDLVTTGTTDSDVIEYFRITQHADQAAIVPETIDEGVEGGGAATGVIVPAVKPESAVEWTLTNTRAQVVAHYVPVTRQTLSNAGVVRTMIDNELIRGLRVELESQMLTGSGTGELLGILNTPGILARTTGAGTGSSADNNMMDTIRLAMADVQVNFYEPNAVVMNPYDAAAMDIMKDTNGAYLEVFDSGTGQLWRLEAIPSPTIAQGTAVVGDYSRAYLWQREAPFVEAGWINDQFIRNALTLLGEGRWAFAVVVPTAFVAVTL